MNTAWSTPTKYVVGISLALLGIYILYLSRPIIPLLVLAALIAMLVRPLVVWLQQRARLPRGLAVILVYLGLVILVPLGLALVIPAIVRAVSYVLSLDYQSIFQGGVGWLRSALTSIKAAQLPLSALDSYVDQTMDALLTALQQATPASTSGPPSLSTIFRSLSSVLTTTFDVATSVVGGMFSQVALLVFMFLASIYISLDAHTYRGALLGVAPAAYQSEMSALLARIERLWGAFFRGQLTLMLLIGTICGLGLAVLGVPGALYLGIIAGLLEIVPSLGPVIATIPAVIVALLQGSTYLPVSHVVLAGLVIVLYVLVQQLENNLVVPRVLGEAVELPALIVIVGVTVGASVGGILGALLATPLIATGREVLRYCYRKMLGEEPFPSETAQTPGARSSMDLFQLVRGWLERLTRSRAPAAALRAPEAAPAPSSGLDVQDQPPNK